MTRPREEKKRAADERTLRMLRHRLIAEGAAPEDLFRRRTRRVPTGQCPREHGHLPPDSKFCGECGTPTAYGPGLKARTNALTTARTKVGGRIARLCGAGCGRVVQRTARGVVVKEPEGFVFRRCCEPCNRAIGIVRGEVELWAKGGDVRARRLAVILVVKNHEEGTALARRLNDERVERKLRGEVVAQRAAEPAPAAAPEDHERAAFRAEAGEIERRLRERLDGNGNPCLTVRNTCAYDHSDPKFCGEPQGWLVVEGTIFPLCYRACSAFVEARKGFLKEEVPPLFTSREGAEEFVARGRKMGLGRGKGGEPEPQADAAAPEAAPAEAEPEPTDDPEAHPKPKKGRRGPKGMRGGRRDEETEALARLERQRKTPKPNADKKARGGGSNGNGAVEPADANGNGSPRVRLGDVVGDKLKVLRASLPPGPPTS